MRMLGKLTIAGASAIVLLQLVRPSIQSRPAVAEVQVPLQVRQILEKNCYSCRSNESRLAWFDEIEPAYWLVRRDILSAREHLNFSTLGSKPAAAQKATLYEAVNMIQLGAMPLPQFTALHPDAKVTPEELTILKTYLAPWGLDGSIGTVGSSLAAEAPLKADLAAAPAEFNGVAFQLGFEGWKPISFTDRGDNNTLRIILGNDIAVKAAKSGDVSPWPDGTCFAKVAWQQAASEDGLIYPGKFVQWSSWSRTPGSTNTPKGGDGVVGAEHDDLFDSDLPRRSQKMSGSFHPQTIGQCEFQIEILVVPDLGYRSHFVDNNIRGRGRDSCEHRVSINSVHQNGIRSQLLQFTQPGLCARRSNDAMSMIQKLRDKIPSQNSRCSRYKDSHLAPLFASPRRKSLPFCDTSIARHTSFF